MNTEIEAKFLGVDFELLREKLNGIGAVCEQPMRLMRRAIIETPEMQPNEGYAFVRIRDEGDKVTVTHKRVHANTVDGTEETEIAVSDFDTAIQLFNKAGLPYRLFQESKRETWRFNDMEIVLDEWPWLRPYIEIEGASETDTAANIKEVRFGDSLPELFATK